MRFFSWQGSKVDPNNLDDLRDKRVGILRGSPVIKTLQAEGFTRIVSEKGYADLIRLLKEGALDATYNGFPMMTAAIADSGMDPRLFKTGTSLDVGMMYICVSRNSDPAEMARWNKAYAAVQADGTVARLQAKYKAVLNP